MAIEMINNMSEEPSEKLLSELPSFESLRAKYPGNISDAAALEWDSLGLADQLSDNIFHANFSELSLLERSLLVRSANGNDAYSASLANNPHLTLTDNALAILLPEKGDIEELETIADFELFSEGFLFGLIALTDHGVDMLVFSDEGPISDIFNRIPVHGATEH